MAAALVTSMTAAAPAYSLSPEAVSTGLAQRFGVSVLRVTALERDGRQLYAVTVMNAGGNFNDAFKVTTLVVDAKSGDLAPQFRSEDSGYSLPAAANREPPGDNGGDAIRRETFRGR